MVFNSKHVLEHLIDPHNYAKAQQHGVDLTVVGFARCGGGAILKDKTIIDRINPVGLFKQDDGISYWLLDPGYYSVTFAQGIKVPPNTKANIIHRSSMLRAGGILMSAEYDAGFQTQNMGAFLLLTSAMKIELGARIAQIVMMSTEETETPYNGQFQNEIPIAPGAV